MVAWLAVPLDSETTALEVEEAALLADADELLAGAAHDASIVTQQHKAINVVSILFMAAPFREHVGSERAGSGLCPLAFISCIVNSLLQFATVRLWHCNHPTREGRCELSSQTTIGRSRVRVNISHRYPSFPEERRCMHAAGCFEIFENVAVATSRIRPSLTGDAARDVKADTFSPSQTRAAANYPSKLQGNDPSGTMRRALK